MANEWIVLNREDVRSELHSNLFDSFIETLNIDPDAREICLQLSPMDENKKLD